MDQERGSSLLVVNGGADDHGRMKLFRKPGTPAQPPAPPSFGEWLVTRFVGEEHAAELSFSKLERVCSNVGSLLCGAVLERPARFREAAVLDAETRAEAALVAKRTADGFRSSLDDRDNTVLSWPWDHLATRVAWKAIQSGSMSERAVGDELLRIGAAYAIAHREQLEAVVGLWTQVVAGIKPDSALSLTAMGAGMLTAYEREIGEGGPPA